jgi:hypothetical protein
MKVFNFQPILNKEKGLTFIDALVGTALTVIVFAGIFGAYHLGIKAIGESRNKITATAVANQEIEKIINLSYQSIGIEQAELPVAEGVLSAFDSVILNNGEYFIERKVEYISEEIGQDFDCPLNYKSVEVKVSWLGRFSGEIKMVSNIAPKNQLEELFSCQAQPGGILSIKVFDAFGIMVPSPLIEVFKAEDQELIASYTPADGRKDVPLSTSTYKIIVSKNSYSSERTYNIAEIANPAKPDPMVLEKEKTEISFSIDKLSSFLINTFLFQEEQEEGEEPVAIANVKFNLRGEKIIGYDEEETLFYKYSQSHVSNGYGQININQLEWDNYFFSVDSETGLNLIEIDPVTDPELNSISLVPDNNLEVNLYLASDNSLLFIAKDDETLEPIFSADVRLFNDDLTYNNLLYTDEKGRVVFIPLEEDVYNLEVSAPGYSSYQGQVSVLGHVKEEKELERIE